MYIGHLDGTQITVLSFKRFTLLVEDENNDGWAIGCYKIIVIVCSMWLARKQF